MTWSHAISGRKGNPTMPGDQASEMGSSCGPVPLAELRKAMTSGRIQARYQPIVRIRDQVPVAIEVLARLAHPALGIVAPDLFVPQIEDAGLAWLLTEAVGHSAFAEWGAGRLEPLGLSLALNVPLDVLLMPVAMNWLDRACETLGIPTSRITIELTESRPVTHLAELGRAVSRLRNKGYQLAIDDVGPGLRDHHDLLALEFSSLKLDQGVVRQAMSCAEAEDFVEHATADAHAAGMPVVAEGITSCDQWAHMAALSVDQAQGFFVGWPMPATSVAQWHRDWLAVAPAGRS